MELVFEKSRVGRKCTLLEPLDVPSINLPEKYKRVEKPRLPHVAEVDLSRHFSELAERTYGVNNGFYPLGSCTMKYNPKVNEEIASFTGFSQIHPLAPPSTVQGCMQVLAEAEATFCEITGMNQITFQPAAGAHGELTGVLLMKAYHQSRGDFKRKKIIVPDSAHGTNPATAAMAGYSVVNIKSLPDGCVDLEALRAALSDETAGLMLTNPNTVGIFDKNILEITKLVHDFGGLNYYDGANLNAIMGVARPGDMGFDIVHLNLHKTFSTPHGGGGPGSGAVCCKSHLTPFMPDYRTVSKDSEYCFETPEKSIGSVKAFYGNFLVVVKAYAYLLTLGAEGLTDTSHMAVLNANYLRVLLKEKYDLPFAGFCMHEFVLSLAKMKKEIGVTAMDIAKSLADYGIHPPTMYFPLIVEEALMFEPTETESIETLEYAADILLKIHEEALNNPGAMHNAPVKTVIRRVDELAAARNPRLQYFSIPN